MTVILYMAMSANGMIARSDDNTSWISEEEWNSYSLAVQRAGCLIIGHRTYDILTKQPEFSEFRNVKVVVVSANEFETLASNHVVAHSPKEALRLLKDFKEVIVAGGSALNASFLTENLVDEIYLDIEPIILGKGIPLFQECNAEQKLLFVAFKMLSSNEIQLHYKVIMEHAC